MKKRTAPLEWNFVSEKNQFGANQARNATRPGIGPVQAGRALPQKEPEKARYVPTDIDRFFLIKFFKLLILSK